MDESHEVTGHTTAGFWAHLHRHIVVFSTMERDLRLTFAAASAVIAVAIALNLLGAVTGPSVETVIGRIPRVTLLALALGELVVFVLVGAGLVRLKGRPRRIAQGGVLLALVLFLAANDFRLPAFALIIPMVILWSEPAFIQRQRWSGSRIGNSAVAAAVLTEILLIFYATTGSEVLVISFVAFQALLAMFGLFMAATDIAEIASLAAESGTSTLARTLNSRRGVVALAIAAITLNALVSFILSGWSADKIAIALGSGLGLALWLAILYGLIQLAGRRLGEVEPLLSYRTLFIVVGIYFVALQVGVAWRVLSDPSTYDARQLFTYPEVFTVPIVVFLISVVLLLLLGRRSAPLYVALGFSACVGMFWFHYFASHGYATVYFLDAVVMGSIIVLVVSSALRSTRPRFEPICEAVGEVNLGFALYAIIAGLFLAAKGTGPGLTALQALIVLVALAWDILSSGEAITNRHTETFQRSARVCFFLAYAVSVALLVMVSSASGLVSPATSREIEGVFESEPLVAAGLVLFGGPFLFLIFTLRMRGAARAVAQAQLADAGKNAPRERGDQLNPIEPIPSTYPLRHTSFVSVSAGWLELWGWFGPCVRQKTHYTQQSLKDKSMGEIEQAGQKHHRLLKALNFPTDLTISYAELCTTRRAL